MSANTTLQYMKAYVLEKPGKLVYMKMPLPTINECEVLVKMKTAAICNGSDPNIFNGEIDGYAGKVFGHEPFGEVVECGERVSDLKVGDCISWWFSPGVFAEYAVVNPSLVSVVHIPKGMNVNEAPITELAVAAFRAIRAAKIKEGTKLLIVGLGPSGLLMSRLAKLKGAGLVAGWDLHAMRREKGIAMGCDFVLDPHDDDVGGKSELLGGKFDVVIDAMDDDILAGSPTLDRAIGLLEKGGIVVSYGHPFGGRRFSPFKLHGRNASIVPPEQNRNEIRKLANECQHYLEEGLLDFSPLVSAVLPLSELAKGMDMVINHPDEYLKIILSIQ